VTPALGWDPTAPAAALRRVQAQLLSPGSLAWFERLAPDSSDPWSSFDALIRAALSGTPAPAPAAVTATARPYTPHHDWSSPGSARRSVALPQAETLAPSVATGIGPERPTARASQPANTSFAALRTIRAGAFANAVPAMRATATDFPAASRPGAAEVPAPAAVGSAVRAHGFRAGSPATPASTRAHQSPQPVAVRPAQPSTPTGLPHPGDATAAEQPPRPPSARVIGWPLARQKSPGGELPTETRRTRVVEGLPALRSLMQSAVAQGRQPDVMPALNAPAGTPPVTELAAPPLSRQATIDSLPMSRPFVGADPLAEEALVDRVIDRLDERLRELSIRHLGFTGGLGT
jgi:hypothetical protein